MLRLRTARGLRIKEYREMTGRDFVRDHQRLVQALHENSLIRIRQGYMRLTRSGMTTSELPKGGSSASLRGSVLAYTPVRGTAGRRLAINLP